MAFSDFAAINGIGRAIRVDVSVDKFASIAARWGSVAGLLDGVNQYSARVISLGSVRRGLGQQRVATGGTTSLVVDNVDGTLDGYAGRENISTQAKVRFRIYLVVFDASAPTVTQSKLLGEFTMTEWTRQTNSTLAFTLGDDVLGPLSQQATLPNFADWQAVGTTTTNPFKNAIGLPSTVDISSAIQLAFGEDWVLAFPHIIPWQTTGLAYAGKLIVPVCCTTDTGVGSDYEITNLRVEFVNANNGVDMYDVPRTYQRISDGTIVTIWKTERSPTITKDGKNFKIIYLIVDNALGDNTTTLSFVGGGISVSTSDEAAALEAKFTELQYSGGYPLPAVDEQGYGYKHFGSRILSWYVKGFPLSARTQQTSSQQHGADVLKDLALYYSNNTGVTCNETMRARVKAGSPNAACAGVVQPWTSGPKKGEPNTFDPPPNLRQCLTKICQSCDIDMFITWDGQLGFSSDAWDYPVATSGTAEWNGITTTGTETVALQTITENSCSHVERWVGSNGERGSPYSRLFFSGGKPYPAERIRDLPYQGPYDFDPGTSGIASTDRIIEATLEQGWRPWRQQVRSPWFWRSLDVIARDRLRIRTHLHGLFLELGAFFNFTWSRGAVGGPYASALFQVEAITYGSDDTVEIEASWRNDTTSSRSYLLDDETLLVRAKNAGNSPITMVDGSPSMTLATGADNFTTMGVAVGDVLVLRDTTQAADVFSRNRTMRITSIFGAGTFITVGTADLAFGVGAGGSVLPAQWYIVRGATTYPTAVSDPTNYPSGGAMYGKVTSAGGTTSDAATGNLLVNG